jgi:hypothetical protein
MLDHGPVGEPWGDHANGAHSSGDFCRRTRWPLQRDLPNTRSTASPTEAESFFDIFVIMTKVSPQARRGDRFS